MKKITKKETKIITTDVYISVDGKEFTREEDCMAWEKSYECMIKTAWQSIKKVPIDSTLIGIQYGSCDDEVYLIVPQNYEEITALNEYIRVTTGSNDRLFHANYVDKALIVDFGCGDYYCSVLPLDTHIKNIQDYAQEIINKYKSE